MAVPFLVDFDHFFAPSTCQVPLTSIFARIERKISQYAPQSNSAAPKKKCVPWPSRHILQLSGWTGVFFCLPCPSQELQGELDAMLREEAEERRQAQAGATHGRPHGPLAALPPASCTAEPEVAVASVQYGAWRS